MTYKKAIKSLEELKCYLPSEFTEKTTSYTEALDTAITVLMRYSENAPHLLPCICGRKRLQIWWDYVEGGWIYECPNCGRKSKLVKKRKELNKAWNDMIQGESD